MTSNLAVTSDQEQAPQTEAQTATPPGELPKWVVRLFGLGALAITAGWVYLLALGVGYLWHQLAPLSFATLTADEAVLAKTSMQESVHATKTASVLAYPSVCGGTVPAKVLDAAIRLERVHGEPLMQAVRVKLMVPAIAADHDGFCRETAEFIAGAELQLERR
jgi:hypothetical protein